MVAENKQQRLHIFASTFSACGEGDVETEINDTKMEIVPFSSASEMGNVSSFLPSFGSDNMAIPRYSMPDS